MVTYSKFFHIFQWLTLNTTISEYQRQHLLDETADILDITGNFNIHLIKTLIEWSQHKNVRPHLIKSIISMYEKILNDRHKWSRKVSFKIAKNGDLLAAPYYHIVVPKIEDRHDYNGGWMNNSAAAPAM